MKKKEQKRRKFPQKVLMCCLAEDLLFTAKSLHRLKCIYSIKHPVEQLARYLAAVCFQGGRIQSLLYKDRNFSSKKKGAKDAKRALQKLR